MIADRMQNNQMLLRQMYDNLRDIKASSEAETLDDALDYFEQKDPFKSIKDAMKNRGAIGIRKKEDGVGYETYTKQRTAEMIESGEYEKLSLGLGRKIINAKANLFTSKTQRWEYLRGDEKIEEEELSLLNWYREKGLYNQALIQADTIASAIESAVIMPLWSGDRPVYVALAPQCVHAKFGDTVIDGDIERGTRNFEIEDASVVVVDLGKSDNSDGSVGNQYLAIFGRSEKYPEGRHVTYTSSTWDGWPSEITNQDWLTPDGQPGNPLTYVNNRNDNLYGSEYPLVIIRGGLTLSIDTLLPTSTTLYENCVEIDVSVSNVLRYSMRSADGNRVITNDKGAPLPKCLDGAIALHDGQTYNLVSLPISNSQGALANIQIIGRSVAEGYNVPGYMVFAEQMIAPESGVALMIRTQPMVEDRERRIGINKGAISRLFDIERGLHHAYVGEPMLADITQTWDAGRWILPEDQTVKADRLKKLLDNKAISYIRYIRDMHDLATDDDAVKYIDRMKEQDGQVQPPKPGLQSFGMAPRPSFGV